MSQTVKLRNINPIGLVDVPILRRQGAPFEADKHGVGCLKPGEEIEVPVEVAGVAPGWRPANDEELAELEAIQAGEQTNLLTGVQVRIVGPEGDDDPDPADLEVEVYDLGFGLLAQSDNYELVVDDELDRKSIAELKEYAAEQDPPVDLTGATTKKAILAAIRKG